jgi:anti-sigma factor RsiW
MCEHAETLRDYAVDELPAAGRREMERHLATCGECAQELDQLRLTTAALEALPDREIPQRIAFVSDKVFAPSLFGRVLAGFWNSAARLGFASACVIAAALVVFAYHRPAVQPVAYNPDISKQVNEAVAKAVVEIRTQDAKITQAALAEHDREYDSKERAQMAAFAESLSYLQMHVSNYSMMASSETPHFGDGQ